MTAGRASQAPRGIVPEGSPFEEFFKEFDDRRRGGNLRPRRSSALGSGFVISSSGFIVTNNHVIDGADEIDPSLSLIKLFRKPNKIKILILLL